MEQILHLHFGKINMKQLRLKIRIVLGLCIWQSGFAQQQIESTMELEALQSLPMEAVYLHINRTTLLPGEYVLYSVYSINMQTYRFSSISKVAYVQLIDSDGVILQSQRIRLKQGRGQGDMFIKTELPTGSYKLVAFTNWIRNVGPNQAFQADLNIINPYSLNRDVLNSISSGQNTKDSPMDQQKIIHSDSGSGLWIEADNKAYAPDNEINIRIGNPKGVLGNGSYSLSVARIEEIPEIPSTSAIDFAAIYSQKAKNISRELGDSIWIPEQREALISGKVINPSEGRGVQELEVVVSLPGADFQLLTGKTNEKGRFNIYMKAPYEGDRAFIDIQGKTSGSEIIQLDNLSRWPTDFGDYRPIIIDSLLKDEILNRSIHNQIENSFFEAKPDTLLSPPSEESFFGYYPRTYNLDDYTRFNTFQETLVEIIQDVWVKKDKENRESLWVRAPSDPIDENYTQDPPIVTLDGVWVQHHKDILGLDARLIKQVRVVQDAIIFGNRKYQGMVSIETFAAKYAGNTTEYSLIPSEPQKRYFVQLEKSTNSHIPDFRHQLYWNPHITIENQNFKASFFSSQVPGNYSAKLEGFTNYGKPISLQFNFEVR